VTVTLTTLFFVVKKASEHTSERNALFIF